MPEHSRDDFAARAEHARRAGDAEAALEIARDGLAREPRHTAGRVAAGLALLDLGRVAEARGELEAIVRVSEAEVAPLSDLEEAEIESAFAAAAPEEESMLDAEGIAMRAVTAVEDNAVEAGPELPGEAFRTEAMAELLERQGDAAGAEAIRASLREGSQGERPDGDEAPATPPRSESGEAAPRVGRARRRTRVEVLERWLHNVRRGQA